MTSPGDLRKHLKASHKKELQEIVEEERRAPRKPLKKKGKEGVEMSGFFLNK